MILQPQDYDFDIKYVKSEQNISDYISRYRDRQRKLIESTVVDKHANFVTFTAVLKDFILADVTTTIKQDKFLQILKQAILNNEWNVWTRNNMI